jgi:hypothetical protein
MLFFVDESWQTVGGAPVGALGGVAIRRRSYNAFCREIYRIKTECLQARELTDSEIKGNSAFSRASFKRQTLHGDSHWIIVAERVFEALERATVPEPSRSSPGTQICWTSATTTRPCFRGRTNSCSSTFDGFSRRRRRAIWESSTSTCAT